MNRNSEIETLKNRLSAQRQKLMDAVGALSLDELTQPFLDGWSPKDILAHLAMAEGVNVKFAKLMLSHERPVQLRELANDYADFTDEFSLDNFNAYMTKKWRAKSLDDVLRALDATRGETLDWVDTLTPEQLERGGQHAAWGEQSVRGMLKILVIHDKAHTQDILKRRSKETD